MNYIFLNNFFFFECLKYILTINECSFDLLRQEMSDDEYKQPVHETYRGLLTTKNGSSFLQREKELFL